MNKNKILSILSAMILLITGHGIKLAKGESTPTSLPTTTIEQTEDEQSIAESMFGVITGKKYNIYDDTVAIFYIKGVEKDLLCKIDDTLGKVDIMNPDGTLNQTIDALICFDFREGDIKEGDRLIGKYGFSEHYFEDTEGYFNGENDVECTDLMSVPDFIKYSKIPEETKKEILEEIKQPLTEDEIAKILLKIKSIDNYYTEDNVLDMSESEYSNITSARDSEFVIAYNLEGIEITIDDSNKTKIYLLGEYIFSEELNKDVIADIFDGTYLMDGDYTNINLDNFRKYVGDKKILEITPSISVDSISKFLECINFRPYFLKSMVNVDGEDCYRIDILRIGFGKINPENLPVKYLKDDIKLGIPSSSIIEQRNTGYDMISEQKNTEKGYTLSRAPKNYYTKREVPMYEETEKKKSLIG